MAIARFPGIVLDCPDPGALATFYGAMLDWKVELSPAGLMPARNTVSASPSSRWKAMSRLPGRLRRYLSRCIST
jgi:hypothetical protein